jgi:hypothetical protein
LPAQVESDTPSRSCMQTKEVVARLLPHNETSTGAVTRPPLPKARHVCTRALRGRALYWAVAAPALAASAGGRRGTDPSVTNAAGSSCPRSRTSPGSTVCTPSTSWCARSKPPRAASTRVLATSPPSHLPLQGSEWRLTVGVHSGEPGSTHDVATTPFRGNVSGLGLLKVAHFRGRHAPRQLCRGRSGAKRHAILDLALHRGP